MKITSKPNSTLKNKTGCWRSFKPKINHSKCIECGMCAKVCPEGIINMTKSDKTSSKLKPKIDYNFCKGCGICAEECPVKAIEMELEEK